MIKPGSPLFPVQDSQTSAQVWIGGCSPTLTTVMDILNHRPAEWSAPHRRRQDWKGDRRCCRNLLNPFKIKTFPLTILWVWMSCLHICMYTMVPTEVRRGGIRPLKAQVTWQLQPSCGCWVLNLSPPQEQQELSTAEPSPPLDILRFLQISCRPLEEDLQEGGVGNIVFTV